MIFKQYDCIANQILKYFREFNLAFCFLPTIETVQGGEWDVHAVDADEGEEVVAEFLDFIGVELFAVGGQVVEERFSEDRCHVATG